MMAISISGIDVQRLIRIYAGFERAEPLQWWEKTMVKHKKSDGHEGDLHPGETVWYYPAPGKDPGPHPGAEPLVAIVARVLTAQSANLTVLRSDGETYGAQSVLCLKKGESALGNSFCTHERLDDVEHPEGADLAAQKAAAEVKEAVVAAAKEAAKDAPAATAEGAKSPASEGEEEYQRQA